MGLVGITGANPAGDTGVEFLSNRDCFLKLFEAHPNLCFDRQLKDRLDRFVKEYAKREIDDYKVLRFTLPQGDGHFVGKLIVNLAKFVYNDKELRELAHQLDLGNVQNAYDIYTDYFEKLALKNPILIVISNFYEEIAHIDDDELNLVNLMLEMCDNVRVWICGEDKIDDSRHSAYQDFYKQFDPIPRRFFEALQAGEQLPYVYFSYNWEGKSDNAVDNLCEIIKKHRIPYQRDKENCGYRQDIHEFMNHIRKGNHVVVLFSKPYLKSFYCLYELTGILDQPDYMKRIYPIIVDKSIREDDFCKELEDYWKSKLKDRVYQDSLRDKTVKRFTLKRKAELMKGYIGKIPVIKDYLSRIDANLLEDMESEGFGTLMSDLSQSIRLRI